MLDIMRSPYPPELAEAIESGDIDAEVLKGLTTGTVCDSRRLNQFASVYPSTTTEHTVKVPDAPGIFLKSE